VIRDGIKTLEETAEALDRLFGQFRLEVESMRGRHVARSEALFGTVIDLELMPRKARDGIERLKEIADADEADSRQGDRLQSGGAGGTAPRPADTDPVREPRPSLLRPRHPRRGA